MPSVTYPYATNSWNINIQATSYEKGTTWTLLNGLNALPDAGGWATVNSTWAPDLIDRGDGAFVMCTDHPSPSSYYTFTYLLQTMLQSFSQNTHCVGAATSTNLLGPYTPQTRPTACQTAGGGAIHPAGFQDADGRRYIVYKVDGSGLDGGGPCGNANGEYSAPIMVQMVEEDALTPTSDPVQILDRGSKDGPLVKVPVLILYDIAY